MAAYFVLLFVISWLTGRGSSNDSFFIGERSSSWYLVAFGMIGASLSGVTFISIPGVVGNIGAQNGQFSYMQMVLGYLVGYTIIATILMPLYYRLKLTSIYTYLERRFNIYAYKTGAGFFLLSRVIGASFRLFLVAIVLEEFVFGPMGFFKFEDIDLTFPFTVLFTLVLIWVYTFRGGIKTIVWTDTLQTLFMLLAIGISIYLIGAQLGLSLGGLIAEVQQSELSQTFFWDWRPKNNFFKQFLGGASIALVMTGLDQDMMQKNNSCKNIGDAQKNMFSFSIILVFVNLVILFLGALLYIYSESKGIAIPERTDKLFPTLALQYFSPLAGAVFVIGLIAAAYSSADSALTSLTTSFCVDFLNFEKRVNESKEGLVRTRHRVHLGFTIVLFITIIIFYYVLERDVVSDLFTFATYTYGPLLGLFTFGLFTKWKIPVDDDWVILVCLLPPILCFQISSFVPYWLDGYKMGFELLLVNGALTFLFLVLIANRQEKYEEEIQ